MVKYCFTLILGLIVLGNAAMGQDAKTVLDQVSKKYDGYRTISAEFSFDATQANGEKFNDSGILNLVKGTNQYYIKLSDQRMISDGKSVWNINSEYKEVQITEYDETNKSIGPNNLFTFYKSGFSYKLLSDQTVNGETMKIVQLTPADNDSNYKMITLRINSRNHIHDITVEDKGGIKFKYTINKLYVNHEIKPSVFKYSKSNYKNYEIVDLR